MARRIRIEDIGAGQWHVTNGRKSMYLPKDLSIVPVAEIFGMRLRHNNQCGDRTSTDGTVVCTNCGRSADRFYGQAYAYLERCIERGKHVEDPGYFVG